MWREPRLKPGNFLADSFKIRQLHGNSLQSSNLVTGCREWLPVSA